MRRLAAISPGNRFHMVGPLPARLKGCATHDAVADIDDFHLPLALKRTRVIGVVACNDYIDGGTAFVGTTVYLPCLSGTVAVQVTASPPALSLLWSSSVGGGPPIVAAGLVWTIGQNGTLYGLDPSTGAVQQQASIGVPANHFPTPSVGDGLLLATSANQVVAFSATVASTPTTTRPKTTKH
jgi:outer membrane protein assembly factor BamB